MTTQQQVIDLTATVKDSLRKNMSGFYFEQVCKLDALLKENASDLPADVLEAGHSAVHEATNYMTPNAA